MRRPSARKALAHPTRRQVLHGVGAALAIAPLVPLFACSADDAEPGASDDDGKGTAGNRAQDTEDAGSDPDTADGAWATGGTAAMKGNYADPFSDDLGSRCALICAATLGPCYAQTRERKDISEGQRGLPVRLAFLVVDEHCDPVKGASVDIWHTSPAGIYSGEDASDMCTFGNEQARAGRWFRGVQTSGSDGRVDFDSCFPGWYSGRTIHIHFTVRVGDTQYVTSQLFFDDTLTDAIIANEPLYDARGKRDTRNTNDEVIGSASVDDYVFQTRRMDDGAMLAWKTLVVRSSTSDALCDL
jgi:protocatechuate 3,4-dioxygenase beta subunit